MQAMTASGLTQEQYYFEGLTPKDWRLNRAARVGHMIAFNAIKACAQHDDAEAAKKKAKK